MHTETFSLNTRAAWLTQVNLFCPVCAPLKRNTMKARNQNNAEPIPKSPKDIQCSCEESLSSYKHILHFACSINKVKSDWQSHTGSCGTQTQMPVSLLEEDKKTISFRVLHITTWNTASCLSTLPTSPYSGVQPATLQHAALQNIMNNLFIIGVYIIY